MNKQFCLLQNKEKELSIKRAFAHKHQWMESQEYLSLRNKVQQKTSLIYNYKNQNLRQHHENQNHQTYFRREEKKGLRKQQLKV